MSNLSDKTAATIITTIIVVVVTVPPILLHYNPRLMLTILLIAMIGILWCGIYFSLQEKHDESKEENNEI
ncbi:hypothetical protein [Listeria seeligeri]|uniref:hypothetical protein n=1 Tax=Listeria seeligeri TaxID=1640 RepID=UPI001623FCA8|nr:hypothetical protein [Listeria seeligeri]MBC1832277.1 hypothetical protein [Listeria seeligeri]MBC1851184.1 hypothetical protein [Listeria seeligeri]MBC1929332.1 hypothetical protein [Listeria seeligeri]MBF2370280.1 hypothetical protein [Listeria seeligeri]MBF2390478.1 hypothetical protein [Listeria seeligeri]